ncbi:MAG: hypothetical protein AAFO15_02705, partial [Pseudomonadota bacterium]
MLKKLSIIFLCCLLQGCSSLLLMDILYDIDDDYEIIWIKKERPKTYVREEVISYHIVSDYKYSRKDDRRRLDKFDEDDHRRSNRFDEDDHRRSNRFDDDRFDDDRFDDDVRRGRHRGDRRRSSRFDDDRFDDDVRRGRHRGDRRRSSR